MTREAYRRSGVDVGAGERAVELMRAQVEATFGPEVLTGLGGFGAAVSLPPGMREPVLVSGADGLGTKTAIASRVGRFDTIGRDVVAMCVDDVVCLGARPLFFLDYVTVEHLDPLAVAELVGSIADGCTEAGCSLVGGETAEHPGLLSEGGFDLAGFCVGVVERAELIDGRAVRAGDSVVGLGASGLHSNGYSLVRALIAEHGLDLGGPYLDYIRRGLGESEADRIADEEPTHLMASLGEVLLEASLIYAPHLLALRGSLRSRGSDLHGLAHVTGGGLPGNVPRALPDGMAARLDPARWPVPSVLRYLAALGGLDSPEMRAIFNGGIGMVAVVEREAAGPAIEFLAARGVRAWEVGEVVAATGSERYAEGPLSAR